MIETSQYWKDHVKDQDVTYRSRLTISFSDYNIDNDISPSVDNPSRESFDWNLSDSIETQSFDYFTWAVPWWGFHLMSETETQYEHGAISGRVANVDGLFPRVCGKFAGFGFAGSAMACGVVNPPTFLLSFTQRLVTSLKSVFNLRNGQHAVDFDIIVYDDTNQVIYTEQVRGNTGSRWNKQLSVPLEDVIRVSLVVHKWSIVGAKAQCLELFTSVQETLEDDDIISFSAVEEISGSGESNNSANTMDFQVMNVDRRYDDDNDASPLQNRITKNRRVRAEIGMVGDNDDLGRQIYYPVGVGYTQDWTVDNDEMIAGANTLDLVSLMDQYEYTKNQFITGDSVGEQFDFTDFTTWEKEGLDGDANGLRMAKYGHAAKCNGAGSFFGGANSFAGTTFAAGCSYVGSAKQSFAFNYVPGTSVNIDVDINENMKNGDYSDVEYSLDGGKTWRESENGMIAYVPDDQAPLQTMALRVFLITQQVWKDRGWDVTGPSWLGEGYTNKTTLSNDTWIWNKGDFVELIKSEEGNLQNITISEGDIVDVYFKADIIGSWDYRKFSFWNHINSHRVRDIEEIEPGVFNSRFTAEAGDTYFRFLDIYGLTSSANPNLEKLTVTKPMVLLNQPYAPPYTEKTAPAHSVSVDPKYWAGNDTVIEIDMTEKSSNMTQYSRFLSVYKSSINRLTSYVDTDGLIALFSANGVNHMNRILCKTEDVIYIAIRRDIISVLLKTGEKLSSQFWSNGNPDFSALVPESITLGLSGTSTYPLNCHITKATISGSDAGTWQYVANTEPDYISTFIAPPKGSLSTTSSISAIHAHERSYVSLYSLAVKVLNDFNDETKLIEGRYHISDSLAQQEIPNAFIRPKSHRKVLADICEAGAARFYVGRDEYINIEMIDARPEQKGFFDNSDTFQLIKHSNPSGLTNRVTVLSNPLIKSSFDDTIAKARYEVPAGETKDYVVKFKTEPSECLEAGINLEVPVAGLTVENKRIYTWGCEFDVINNTGSEQRGKVIVSGKPYTVEGQERISLDNTESIRKFGVIERVIDNPLIQSEEQAVAVAAPIIASYSEHKRECTSDLVPDVSLEAGDGVTIDGIQYKIKSQGIDLERGLTQQIKGER